MKIKLLLLFAFVTTACVAQDTVSIAPVQQADTTITKQPLQVNSKNDSIPHGQIIYFDLAFGGSFSTIHGLYFSSSLNYQLKQNLFTVRATGIYDHTLDFVGIPFIPIPRIRLVNSLEEKAVLYGRRFINKGQSISISAGISYNEWMKAFPDGNNGITKKRDYYPGLPFEMNILWFKSTKKRFRIYGLIPVGKPTGFGSSIGFKLSGNVSRHGFVALGIVWGIGMHKHY